MNCNSNVNAKGLSSLNFFNNLFESKFKLIPKDEYFNFISFDTSKALNGFDILEGFD